MISPELYPSWFAVDLQKPRLCSAHNPSTLRYAGQARLHYITPDKRRISAGSSEPASPRGRESSFPERTYVKERDNINHDWEIVVRLVRERETHPSRSGCTSLRRTGPRVPSPRFLRDLRLLREGKELQEQDKIPLPQNPTKSVQNPPLSKKVRPVYTTSRRHHTGITLVSRWSYFGPGF